MTMTNTEQNDLFQAMKAAGLEQVLVVNTQSGNDVYQLCGLHPVASMNPTDAAAFALLYGVTIASP